MTLRICFGPLRAVLSGRRIDDFIKKLVDVSLMSILQYPRKETCFMDANGLNEEQQALLASIMGKSSQAGGGGGFSVSQVPAAQAAPAAAPSPADSGKMLSQAEIDALIASMGK